MRPTSIFLSSTCFDLRSLREHLRSEITSWGHDPILSEYPSFPVAPDLSTVENCKKVVKERADIFVLIIGGKRGSLDPDTNRSVVNSEYRQARNQGIDCFIFVDRQVWELLAHYQRNPESDFSCTVDNPEVFKFINEVQKETKWIFPFSRTEEILTTLKIQLSIRLQDLLTRIRSNTISIPIDFVHEPSDIASIARDKESFWEYRLTSALMKERLKNMDRKFSDLNSGFVTKPLQPLLPTETFTYITSRLNDMSAIIQASVKILQNQLTPAFGPPGIPGNASEIKRACDNLNQLFESLYEWELAVRFVKPHELFEPLFNKMHGWTNELIPEFHRIPNEIDQIFSSPNPTGDYLINLIIKSPSGLSEFGAEMERLGEDPRVIELLLFSR